MQLSHAKLEDLLLCAGAQLFCFKKLSQKLRNGLDIAVELDGAAVSDSSCIIVERKQQFRHMEVFDLIEKIKALK